MERKCYECGKIKLLEEFKKDSRCKHNRRHLCKECYNRRERKWRKQNPEKLKIRKKRYRKIHKDKINEYSRKYRRLYPERDKQYHKKYYEKLRLEVLVHYSGDPPKCASCEIKDIRILEIDHTHNDGAQHRRKISRNIYNWLKDNNFPEGFQVLCRNCNWIKRLEN